MDVSTLIGPGNADVIVFNKGGRGLRLDRINSGEEAPREFFYGFFDLAKAGIRAAMMSSSGVVPGWRGLIADRVERGLAYATGLGIRPFSTRIGSAALKAPRVLMSYTDGFSLSLGLGMARGPGRPILIGGFHGLSDVESRVRMLPDAASRRIISRCLDGLDHVFFFGPADREEAIRRYGLSPDRCSVIPFGVDTEFWRSLPDEAATDFVVAVGQDPSRDYGLLASAPGKHPTVIVTHRKVAVPSGATHVRVTSGDFFAPGSMSDQDLRRLYNQARAVIVPLKDVYQPSGYSVTLQAMSCGRPVILSNIRGLWAPELLRDGENCLLVPPGDAAALGAAIGRVRSDPALAERLGRAARDTAVRHFGLDRIAAGTVALAQLGLSLHEQGRQAA